MQDKVIAFGNRFFSRKENQIITILVITIYSMFISYSNLHSKGAGAGDFQWTIKASEYVLNGINPYYQNPTNGIYPYETPFLYPLPTAIFGIPFTLFAPDMAGVIFFGLSSALLAYAIIRDGWQKLPVFFSIPFLYSAVCAQWTPLLMAAALLPDRFRILAFLKPSTGLISFIYRPSKWALIAFTVISALILVILPTWPWDWFDAIMRNNGQYGSILLAPFGFLMLLSILTIKTRAGRTLLAASVVPRHVLWYDGPMLWLVAENLFQSFFLTVLSWMAWFVWMGVNNNQPDPYAQLYDAWRWQVIFLYVPALSITLWARFGKNLLRRPRVQISP